MLVGRDILCDLLICIVGNHPWDYASHFLANFCGVLLLFVVLSNAWRVSPKKVWKLSPKTSLLVSIVLACIVSAEKEFEDILRGAFITDTVIDAVYDFLGTISASMIIILATRVRRLRIFRHP